MKKMRSKKGFTLIEVMASLLITVLLVAGMSVGIDAGMRVYGESVFEADSAALSNILNTTLGDILRYADNVRRPERNAPYVSADGRFFVDNADTQHPEVDFVFTSMEYQVQDGYFPDPDDSEDGYLQIANLRNGNIADIVNTGAYPELKVRDFEIVYTAPGEDGKEGGYFDISYVIESVSNADRTREVEYCVRLMNK